MKWLRFFLITTLLPFAAQAAEPSVYAPEHCDFTATFPEEPYKTQRCDEDNTEQCYEQISYTKVYELSSTVNFRVICNPVDESLYKNYSGAVMKKTLEAMTTNTVVKKFESTFREEENYKQAGLVGEGKVGRTPTIYIAQLWIGHGSALTVEAELIGEAHEDADLLFSEVMKSIRYRDPNEEVEEEASEETQAEDEESEEKEDN